MKVEEVLKMCGKLCDLETLKEQASKKFISLVDKGHELEWKSFWAGYYQASMVRAQNEQ